jgi:hypothetical protein
MLPSLYSNAPNEPPSGESSLLPESVHRLEVGALCRNSFDWLGFGFLLSRSCHALTRFFARLAQTSLSEIKHFLYAIRQSWFNRAKNDLFPLIELVDGNSALTNGVTQMSGEPPYCCQAIETEVFQIDDPGAYNALRSYANYSTFIGKREDSPPRFLSHVRYTFLTLIELGAGPNNMPAKTTARTL